MDPWNAVHRNYGLAFTNLSISLVILCNQKTNSMLATGGGTVPEFLGKKQLSIVNWCDPTEIRYAKFQRVWEAWERERHPERKIKGNASANDHRSWQSCLTNTCLLILKQCWENVATICSALKENPGNFLEVSWILQGSLKRVWIPHKNIQDS